MRLVGLGIPGRWSLDVRHLHRADDPINVNVDQAQLVNLPDRVATIIIGNPLIADATVQNGGILVVTGKGYGMTNLLALDRDGRVLMSRMVEVRGAGTSDVVTVYKGIERESYSCTPNCERRITLGDSAGFFNATLSQSGARNGQAQGSEIGTPAQFGAFTLTDRLTPTPGIDAFKQQIDKGPLLCRPVFRHRQPSRRLPCKDPREISFQPGFAG